MEHDIKEEGYLKCSCHKKENAGEPRKRQIANGTWQAGWHCQNCGRFVTRAFKSFSKVPEVIVDETIAQEFEKRCSEFYSQRSRDFATKKQEESERWKRWYSEYLSSNEWRQRRLKVLSRDKNTCQACLDSPATEVHHLTYERVGNEPLFDLVSICSSCHQKVHNRNT